MRRHRGRQVSTYFFEGEMLSISEIHSRVPALSEGTILHRIRKLGQTTAMEMLTYRKPAPPPPTSTFNGARKGPTS